MNTHARLHRMQYAVLIIAMIAALIEIIALAFGGRPEMPWVLIWPAAVIGLVGIIFFQERQLYGRRTHLLRWGAAVSVRAELVEQRERELGITDGDSR